MRGAEGPGRAAFSSALPLEEAAPLPIAHGEGRFVTGDPQVLARIEAEGLGLFRYVAADGSPAGAYPDDPNGAMLRIAGLTNRAGTVLALMPHPERAAQLRHVPLEWPGAWGDRRRAAVGKWEALEGPGPGRFLFESLARRLGVPAGAAHAPAAGAGR
jgi:phosphoribosylformylglycinamidine (FGAM) synthase-like amidotransferase family enzyme